MNPFFSIVIPSYNRLSFLKDALQSIWNQSFIDFEVIVVNDGSTDGTTEFLDAECRSHSNLKAIHQANTERGAARNNGWKIAKGDYVVFFDSDDLMKHDYLETLKSNINLFIPKIIACKFEFIKNEIKKTHRDSISLKGWHDYKLFLNGNPLACHFAIKNEPHILAPFNESRSLSSMEDWLFLIENTRRVPIYIVDKICISMQIHSTQSMVNDAIVIERKRMAFELIKSHFNLKTNELNTLKNHVNENIAIHEINRGNKSRALKMQLDLVFRDRPTLKRIYNIFRALK